MVKYMFQLPTEADFEMLYGNLKTQGTIDFGVPHSFVVQHLIRQSFLLMSFKT